MFTGRMNDPKFKAACPPAIQRMLDILNNPSLLTQKCDKYEVNDGMFYVLMEYETVGEVRPETHRKYIDIQIVLRGKESMGWAPLLENSQIETPYNNEKDILYYHTPEVYNLLACPVGSCNIFFPNDIHAPGLIYHQGNSTSELVKKIVGKIPVELIFSQLYKREE